MTEARRFTGGRVFTGRRFVESLAVEDGRVVCAGTESEVARNAAPGCEVERLEGRLVVPGLVDAHLHIAEVTRAEHGLPLARLSSREDLADRVRRWAAQHRTGPIIGRGWDVERFPDQREPTRRDLESAVADRPVVLFHASGHAAVVNGAALAAVGYSDRSPDPPGGRLGRGPDGGLDGLVYERAIDPLARLSGGAHPPDPSEIAATLREIAALGITTVGTLNTDPEELDVLTSLGASGALAVRVRAYVRFGLLREVDLTRPLRKETNGRLAVSGAKAFTDGAFGPRTAWLSEPYADRPDRSGDSTLSRSEIGDVLRTTAEAGLVPALHAIGDRALGTTLDSLEEFGPGRGRARIEHAALVPPELYSALDRVRPALIVQPGFVWSDAWLADRLGPERARYAYPFRTLIERGHLLVGSSDAPYDPVDPWRGLAAAVSRVDPEGRSANPSSRESLTPAQAFQLYTVNAGMGIGEADIGTLEVGAHADLVVLDAPDLTQAVARGRSGVSATWIAGQRAGPPDLRGKV